MGLRSLNEGERSRSEAVIISERITDPEDVQVLSPRTCKYVSLRGKRHFANVIKVKNLEMGDYPGLSGGRSTVIRGPFKAEHLS